MLVRVILAVALGLSTVPVGICALLCGSGPAAASEVESAPSCCPVSAPDACPPEQPDDARPPCGGDDGCRACELVCPRISHQDERALPPLDGQSHPAVWEGGVDYLTDDAGAATTAARRSHHDPPPVSSRAQSVTCVWLI